MEISRKTMGGWLPAVTELINPLYQTAKKFLFESKVIGTDDTGVKVLDRKLPFARTGRIWPYVGDAHHPVVVYDYTPTRGRDGPAKFLEGYQGYLQADAYCVYDAFFKPTRGLTEVGCMMHSRRYFFKALESDQQRMGKVLHLIARLYAIEGRATGLTGEERLRLRQRLSAPVMSKLYAYLIGIRNEVLPKSPAATAVRYSLNQWDALARFLTDGDLEIDNGATERANRAIAIGRGNWTFFGSANGGKTAAVLLSFIEMCKRNAVEPFAWFLSRIAAHPVKPSCSRITGSRLIQRSRPNTPNLAAQPRLAAQCGSRDAYAERNLSVDHTTVWRWVQRYAPELNKRIRREVKPTNGSWRTDETYVRVAGRWTYLYRAVDSTGATIDFLLSETRDLGAARRFFQKALAAPGHPRPRVITVDGNPSYPAVIQELKRAGALGRRCRCRPVPYLNNIVEQDHRAIKRRINAKLGFRSLEGAWCTIQGYEAMHMIRKGQVRWLPKGDLAEQVRFINVTFGLAA